MPYPYKDNQGNELPGPEVDDRSKMSKHVRTEYRQGTLPTVVTVGELVKQLSELPRELPLSSDGYEGFRVVVYNATFEDIERMHAVIESEE